MEKKLIPYSVYLPEAVYLQVKDAAKGRKAAAIVRNAIVSYLDEKNPRLAGYKEGISDAMRMIRRTRVTQTVSFKGEPIADILITKLETMRGRHEEKGRTKSAAQTRPAAN